MNLSVINLSLAAALVATLAACEPSPTPAQNAPAPAAVTMPDGEPQTVLGKAAQRGIEKARDELARSNINLNNEFRYDGDRGQTVAKTSDKDPADPRANAELTPQGELLLDGRKVETTPAQHALLVKYRQQIMDVAETGMALGVQGADLGGTAIREVVNGLLSGNPGQIDAKIEAEAAKLEVNAKRLCMQLPPLHETQQQLAVALPEFKPYATIEKEDLEDCRGGSFTTQ
ncbi:hypothetical protein ACW7G0_05410 [Lysobacter sp. A286]